MSDFPSFTAKGALIWLCQTYGKNLLVEFNGYVKDTTEDLVTCGDIDNFKTRTKSAFLTFLNRFSKGKSLSEIDLYCFNSFFFTSLHDLYMPQFNHHFAQKNLQLYHKCLSLSHVSFEQFGVCPKLSVQCTSAIVELSCLDTKLSPAEKMSCLCTSYDLIYAELKISFIETIVENSRSEMEIPVINSAQVLPLLLWVLVQSKLTNFYSNLNCIETYIGELQQNRTVGHVLRTFKETAYRLENLNQSSFTSVDDNCRKTIDFEELVSRTSLFDNNTIAKNVTKSPSERRTLRAVELIIRSTEEGAIK